MLTTSLAESQPTNQPHIRLCQLVEATRALHGCVLRITRNSFATYQPGFYAAELVSGKAVNGQSKQWQVIAIILADRKVRPAHEQLAPEQLVILECTTDKNARWIIDLDRLENYFIENRVQEVSP